jgi:hypothetical protein
MNEILQSFSEPIFALGSIGGLIYIKDLLRKNPKDWALRAVIALTFILSTVKAINAYLGV